MVLVHARNTLRLFFYFGNKRIVRTKSPLKKGIAAFVRYILCSNRLKRTKQSQSKKKFHSSASAWFYSFIFRSSLDGESLWISVMHRQKSTAICSIVPSMHSCKRRILIRMKSFGTNNFLTG